jgi:4-amino-4-deoxy-L-arabinose transferase-like glycosyltransferase
MWAMTAVMLAAAALRVPLLSEFRLHPDEALYATLGRLMVTGRDPLLMHTTLLVDKPPLFYAQLAAGIAISWGSELAARLPGLFASLASVALTGRLAWLMWRSRRAALAAMLVIGLSPLAIQFSATAFADALMVMWLLAALCALAGGRPAAGGALLAAALGTKQSAVLFVPLAVWVLAASTLAVWMPAPGGEIHAAAGRRLARDVLRLAAGMAPVVIAMAAWGAARGVPTGAWLGGVALNDPGRIVRSGEVWPRAREWAVLLGCLAGSGAGSAAVGLLIAGAVARDAAGRRRDSGSMHTLLIVATMIALCALYWLVAFPIRDRYLLPLAPLAALLAGREIDAATTWAARRPLWRWAGRPLWRWVGRLAAIGLAAALVIPAMRASAGAYPVGGDHGAFDGIEQVAAELRALTPGSVVYYDVLGWTLHYYLFDAPVYLAPFGSPAALASDLAAFGGTGAARVIVMPGWESHAEVLSAVEGVGYYTQPVLTTYNRLGDISFVMYRIDTENE